MTKITFSWVIKVLTLVGALNASALGSFSPASIIRLDRDFTYEQNLKYLASADTAITPTRVLRWISSLTGHAPKSTPSNFEFQPIFRANDTQTQIIAQIAYKF